MGSLFLVIIGFFGGIIMTRNSEPMNSPQTAGVFLCMIVGCGLMWYMGYRGKSSAVATAIATATATAKAEANAQARSVASSAINLYLGQQAGVSPEILDSIVDHSVHEIDNHQSVIDHEQHIDSDKETA